MRTKSLRKQSRKRMNEENKRKIIREEKRRFEIRRFRVRVGEHVEKRSIRGTRKFQVDLIELIVIEWGVSALRSKVVRGRLIRETLKRCFAESIRNKLELILFIMNQSVIEELEIKGGNHFVVAAIPRVAKRRFIVRIKGGRRTSEITLIVTVARRVLIGKQVVVFAGDAIKVVQVILIAVAAGVFSVVGVIMIVK